MVERIVERVRVCGLDELADRVPLAVTARGRPIALCRVGDAVFALGDACPHRGAQLSFGRIPEDRLELICPWHFFRFDLRTGASVTIPNLVNQTYPVVVEDGEVFVELSRPAEGA